jgi:hypothetical protein
MNKPEYALLEYKKGKLEVRWKVRSNRESNSRSAVLEYEVNDYVHRNTNHLKCSNMVYEHIKHF